MLKILIADGTEGFRDQLRDILAKKYTVFCADDGIQAWELFQNNHPNLLVVDLELREMDGITLLQRIHTTGYRPAVIVLARLISDYAVDALMQMKVDYLLRKPCRVHAAAQQAEKLLRYQMQEESPARIAIAGILRDFGIPDGYSGSKYLLTAVMLMALNPSQYITKELYPTIGKDFGKSGEQVERSIRHAIGMGHKNGNPAVWESCFGKDENGMPKKPRNGDFITEMANILKNKL